MTLYPAPLIRHEQSAKLTPELLGDFEHGIHFGATGWCGRSTLIHGPGDLIEIPPDHAELCDGLLKGQVLRFGQWGDAPEMRAG